jgi:hypothetical protein
MVYTHMCVKGHSGLLCVYRCDVCKSFANESLTFGMVEINPIGLVILGILGSPYSVYYWDIIFSPIILGLVILGILISPNNTFCVLSQ